MEETFIKEFGAFVKKQRLFEPSDTVILAISGGLDSVVLAHLLWRIKQSLVLAHCNFQLRGDESNRDEQFVRGLAQQFQLPLYVESYDTKAFAIAHKLNTQLAARQLRYDFFERLRVQLSQKPGRVWVATAHHANDAAETMLINLFRGTGIDGLKGIPVKNGFVIRPLLFAYREQIEKYAKLNGLSWVEDSSNEKEDYARNLVRHSVLPAAQQKFPEVVHNLAGTMERLQEVAALFHQMIGLRLKKMVVHEGDLQKIPALKLAKATERNTLVWEWIKGAGFTEGQVSEVVKLTDAATGSYILSGSHRILKNRAWLILSPTGEEVKAPRVIEQVPAVVAMPDGQLLKLLAISEYDSNATLPNLPAYEAWLDAEKVAFPLLLRPWKTGDYFYPLGMAKKKKVARFLIDIKASAIEKEKVWVLESNKRILWVVGYRIDDRFKLTGNTKRVLKMKVSSE